MLNAAAHETICLTRYSPQTAPQWTRSQRSGHTRLPPIYRRVPTRSPYPEKVEKVVSAPRRPTVKKPRTSCEGFPKCAKAAIRTPITKDPPTFTINVPHGNPEPKRCRDAAPAKCRKTAPIAPPAAIAKIMFIMAYPFFFFSQLRPVIEAFADVPLKPALGRIVECLPRHVIGKIILAGKPFLGIGIVLVSRAIAFVLHQFCRRVQDMPGRHEGACFLRRFHRLVDRRVGRVGFGCGGQIHKRLRQREFPFRAAQPFICFPRGHTLRQRIRLRQPDILHRHTGEPPRDITRVFRPPASAQTSTRPHRCRFRGRICAGR